MMGTTADKHLDTTCHSTQLTGLPLKPTAKVFDTLPLVTISKEATQRHTCPMTPSEISTHAGIMPASTAQPTVQVGEKVDPPPQKFMKQTPSMSQEGKANANSSWKWMLPLFSTDNPSF
jgi:hypothetical protein